MTTHLTATVIDGMLRPDESLELPDETRVRLTLDPIIEKPDPVAAWESIKSRLRERPIRGTGTTFTRDELHERR